MAVGSVSVGGSAAPALLVALLAGISVVAGGTTCDGWNCGMGTCKDLPAIPAVPKIFSYECDCDAGWARVVGNLTFAPCFVPTCSSDASCYTPNFKFPPLGSNITLHPCLVVDCGREGTCVEDSEPDKPFHCQCNSGATNMFNNPSFPCTNNCAIGADGCPVPNPPPPSWTDPAGSAAPPGNKGSTTIQTSLGSVCLQNLLLLASLAALYIV